MKIAIAVKISPQPAKTASAAGLRLKQGSNCNPGKRRKAGKVMRLKTPTTAMNERIV